MTQTNTTCVFLLLSLTLSSLLALSHPTLGNRKSSSISRKDYFSTVTKSVAAIFLPPQISSALEEEKLQTDLIDVYFGCGCFWHVQHEFVMAERSLLHRSDDEISSRAGYAGGRFEGSNGRGQVCYHNAGGVSDYGSLGHAEVVGIKIPRKNFAGFAEEYVKLFDANGNRPDQFGDRGSEYRNLVGVPGGVKGSLAQQLVDISKRNGDKLDFAVGKGNDADTRAAVYIMDTNDFSFHVAEQYHQFHDGFNFGENYPKEYNGLASSLAKKKILGVSDCPNGLLGLGVAGL